MTNDEYLKEFCSLCKECDDLLIKKLSSNLVATSWLHVLRDHTEFTKKYDDYIKRKSLVYLIVHAVKKIILNTIHIFIKILSGFNVRPSIFFEDQNNKQYIFLTHCINSEEFKKKDDFYFGDIPRKISNGSNVGIIAFNWSGTDLLDCDFNDEIDRFFLYTQLGFQQECKICFTQFLELAGVIKLLLFKEISLRFFFNLCPHILSQQTANNLRFLYQFKKLIKQSNPRFVLTTFEGHAHERLFFNAAKIINNDVVTIGFQHAASFKNQHSLFRSLTDAFDPSEIWAIGSFSQSRFQASYPMARIITSGSPRTLQRKIDDRHNEPLSILVVPEGMEYEVEFMLDFVIRSMRIYPLINFRIRLHPLIKNLPNILNKLNYIDSSNFSYSDESLLDDLTKSHYLFYRGSSVVIDALHCNVIPIYIENISDFAEIDPLFMLKKIKCSKPEELDFLAHIDHAKWANQLNESEDLFKFASNLKIQMQNVFPSI